MAYALPARFYSEPLIWMNVFSSDHGAADHWCYYPCPSEKKAKAEDVPRDASPGNLPARSTHVLKKKKEKKSACSSVIPCWFMQTFFEVWKLLFIKLICIAAGKPLPCCDKWKIKRSWGSHRALGSKLPCHGVLSEMNLVVSLKPSLFVYPARHPSYFAWFIWLTLPIWTLGGVSNSSQNSHAVTWIGARRTHRPSAWGRHFS